MTDRHLDLELKIGGVDESGTFEGVASVFGELDLMGDTIAPGAFKKSLATHKRSGRTPLMLWSHQLDQPIGKWTSITETAGGLAVKGKLLLDVARAREVYAMLREKVVDGLSIGFRTVKSQRIKTGRLLQELDLAEISLVTMPCAPNARVSSVKSTSNGGRRSIPLKDPLMSNDTYEDGAVETAAVELPPEVLERITNIETKAGAVDEIATRLDRIETRLARPSARIEVREDQQQLERKAFVNWCRKGFDGLSDLERKVLTVGTQSPDPGGWATVPEFMSREIVRMLTEINPMRQVARVQQVAGGPVLIPKRTANLTASWVAETVEHDVSEPVYAQQSVGIFEARVTTEVSNQLLEDSAFDLAAELARDFAEEFGRLEGEAFVSGNGQVEPEGFLTGDFATTEDALDADGIIDLFYRVPAQYAQNGTWLMARAVQGAVRKFRSAVDGPYVWADSLVPGQPATLLGRPVLEMPSLTTAGGSPAGVVAAFGDWGRAFRIFDRVGLEVLRDPYTLARRSIVAFHARKRVGSALVLPEAVRGMSA